MTLIPLLVVLMTVSSIYCLDNGLALTPPMGWMSWERYRCITDCDNYPDECISEKLFRKTAELMVSEGYLDAGYEYIIIDDCWLATERDTNGKLQPNHERFPNGIKALSDYVHSLGLKFGIYEDYGNYTCAGYPGVLGHLEIDAQTFAEWDVDYVKLDGCYAESEDYPIGYPEFGRQLNKTGRPMVYSCSWPAYIRLSETDFDILTEYCNLWRNYGDIDDSWSSVTNIMDWFAKNQKILSPYHGPGHWHDPDMLIIGNYGLSYDQSKSQMALWAVFGAPLLMSTDLSSIKPEYKAILQNKAVIAVNQDPLGKQGLRVLKEDGIEIWTKEILPIINGYSTYAIAVLSRRTDGHAYRYKKNLEDLGLNNTAGYELKDLFEPEFHTRDTSIDVRVNPTGVVFLHATPVVGNM